MRCLMTCAWRVTPETHQMQDSLVGRFSISCGSRSCFLAGQDEAIVQDESIVVCCKGFKQQFGNAFVQSRPTLLLLVSVCRWEQDNHLDPGVFGWSSTCKLAHVVASLDESPLIRSKATPVCLSIPRIKPPTEIQVMIHDPFKSAQRRTSSSQRHNGYLRKNVQRGVPWELGATGKLDMDPCRKQVCCGPKRTHGKFKLEIATSLLARLLTRVWYFFHLVMHLSSRGWFKFPFLS